MNEKDIKSAKHEERMEKSEKKVAEKHLEKRRARIYEEMVSYEKEHRKEAKIAPKGSFISLNNVNKIYPNHVQAVYDFNLDIQKHEFIVLVGPSGCGKSTTLRMIAGLEDITAGDLYIDGMYANLLHPKDRDIAMVFQSYALYPHMSVAGNMAFSLRIRRFPEEKKDKNGNVVLAINKKLIRRLERQKKSFESFLAKHEKEGGSKVRQTKAELLSLNANIEYFKRTPVSVYVYRHMKKEEIALRVEKAARILQIQDYLNRKPKALSGGQCQRVALGRAIVRKAKVFLMDEPLSNLDAKLRVAMRSEIRALHDELGATTIYVTHDQTEAMTMATRIVVMNKGFVQQIGTPMEIYNHPANQFVASFIGSPAMNMLPVHYRNGKVAFKDGTTIELLEETRHRVKEFYAAAKSQAEAELSRLDEHFFERNALLGEIKNLKEKKNLSEENHQRLAKLTKELYLCEASNEKRATLVKRIEDYEKLDLRMGVDLVLGIRPEDIYPSFVNQEEKVTPPLNLKVTFSELLGREYFVHSSFVGIDLVAKISSKSPILAGSEISVVFDLENMHLFDSISGETIY